MTVRCLVRQAPERAVSARTSAVHVSLSSDLNVKQRILWTTRLTTTKKKTANRLRPERPRSIFQVVFAPRISRRPSFKRRRWRRRRRFVHIGVGRSTCQQQRRKTFKLFSLPSERSSSALPKPAAGVAFGALWERFVLNRARPDRILCPKP